MACILHLETSATVCSVALSSDNQLVWNKECDSERQHAKLLAVYVDEAIEFALGANVKLDAVAVSCGPGSYTGLRIGVSLAKGLCYGYGTPLISVHTTDVLLEGILNTHTFDESVLFCPMIDARRMEVYTCLMDKHGVRLNPISAQIVDSLFLKAELENNRIYFFGDGADKCINTIQHKNAFWIDQVEPLAKNMIRLAYEKYDKKDFEDVAYFEPFYLKDFLLTESKKKFF